MATYKDNFCSTFFEIPLEPQIANKVISHATDQSTRVGR